MIGKTCPTERNLRERQSKVAYFTDTTRQDAIWKRMSWLLFLFVFSLICLTFLDYGITWDEEAQKNYGNAILAWYASFFKNSLALNYSNLYLYGGFFETLVQFLTNIAITFAPVGLFETRHFLNALTGLLGIIGCWKLGTLVAGPKAGFFSALSLTLTPHYYGHMFNNSKDIPFAVLFLFSVYYLILFHRSLPRPSKSLATKLAITLGLTLAIRVGGLILYVYLMSVVAIWIIHKWHSQPQVFAKRTMLQLGSSVCFVFVLSWAVMLVWWPWAQVSPVSHPLEALQASSHFGQGGRLLFDGTIYTLNSLPWTYLPVWLLISLPEFYFTFVLTGIIVILYFLQSLEKIHGHPGWAVGNAFSIGLLTVVFTVPVVVVIITRPNLYDGMRHFLFLLPILAVLSGVAFSRFTDLQINSLLKQITATVIVFLMGLTAYDMVDLHPYQTIYFNRLIAGGLSSAHSRFETDYWGNSFKEGSLWLLKNHRHERSDSVKVAVNCGNPTQIGYYLKKDEYINREKELMKLVRADHNLRKPPALTKNKDERFDVVNLPEHADLVLSTTRTNCHTKVDGEVIYTVRRKNVPILYIIRRSRLD